MNENYEAKVNDIKKENPFISQTDIAYKMITHNILENIFKPGDKINQENLSQMFSMSRTPIREALVRLEVDGLVEKNDKGYQVYKTNIRDYIDFYEYRMRLEGFAAYLAARLISEDELDELKSILAKYLRAIDNKEYKLTSEMDIKFHETIVKASKNSYLIKGYSMLKTKNRIFINRLDIGDEYFKASKKKHLDIFKAIKDRDEKLAQEMMTSHLMFYIYRLNNIR